MKSKLLLIACITSFISCSDSLNWDESQLYYEYDYASHTATVVKTPNDFQEGYIGIGYSEYSGNISIPSNVTYYNEKYEVVKIKQGAFVGCTQLKSIKIPKTVTDIERYAFSSPNLDVLIVDSENPKYDSRYDCNAIIETATNTLLFGSNKTVIPNNIKIIESYSFENLTFESLKIPEGVQRIEHHTLWNLPNLKSIEIPSSVSFLGENVLSYCPSLESVSLGKGIKTLDYDVLRDNPLLKTVVCKAITPPSCNASVFGSISKEAILYVPQESISLYSNHDKWRDCFKEILPILSQD